MQTDAAPARLLQSVPGYDLVRAVRVSALPTDLALAGCSSDCLSQYVCRSGLVDRNDTEDTVVAHEVGVVEGATRRDKRGVAESSGRSQPQTRPSGVS